MSESLTIAAPGRNTGVTESALRSYQHEIARCARKIAKAMQLRQFDVAARYEAFKTELTERMHGKPRPRRAPRRREHYC